MHANKHMHARAHTRTHTHTQHPQVKVICKETGQKPPKFRDLAKLFADSDADNSGDIDWDEFTVMYVFVLVWVVRLTTRKYTRIRIKHE